MIYTNFLLTQELKSLKYILKDTFSIGLKILIQLSFEKPYLLSVGEGFREETSSLDKPVFIWSSGGFKN